MIWMIEIEWNSLVNLAVNILFFRIIYVSFSIKTCFLFVIGLMCAKISHSSQKCQMDKPDIADEQEQLAKHTLEVAVSIYKSTIQVFNFTEVDSDIFVFNYKLV